MKERPSAKPFVPDHAGLTELAVAAHGCQGCELYRDAIQTVFGTGRTHPRIMLVGEQPGDQEDRQGTPFVGPAGHLLDRALAEAGIDRSEAYLTNAVKHFRFKSTESSTRRIHQKPSAGHVYACEPWLAAELAVVQPKVLVALGATAVAALFGTAHHVQQDRGKLLSWPAESGPFAGDSTDISAAVITIHPSAVLRAGPEREEAYQGLVSDLQVALEAAT